MVRVKECAQLRNERHIAKLWQRYPLEERKPCSFESWKNLAGVLEVNVTNLIAKRFHSAVSIVDAIVSPEKNP